MNMPISRAHSRPGMSHVGPIVRRAGSSTCRPMAASTVSWAGQNGSAAARGG